ERTERLGSLKLLQSGLEVLVVHGITWCVSAWGITSSSVVFELYSAFHSFVIRRLRRRLRRTSPIWTPTRRKAIASVPPTPRDNSPGPSAPPSAPVTTSPDTVPAPSSPSAPRRAASSGCERRGP